jgi:Flp pilus assembly protein TadG
MGTLRGECGRRGVVTVEMAILVPVFVLFVFGIIEYGWMFTKAHQITNAARHAARLAVMPDASLGAVQAEVATLMTKVGLAGKYELTFTPSDNLTAYATGAQLTVTVKAAYSAIALTHVALVPTPASLSATVTMAKEGP